MKIYWNDTIINKFYSNLKISLSNCHWHKVTILTFHDSLVNSSQQTCLPWLFLHAIHLFSFMSTMESFLVSSIKDPGTWYVEINELSVDWLVGSWRLKASSVECWSIPSVDPRHSINTQINTGPTLDHRCSVNSCLSVPQLMHRWEIRQLSTCCGSNVKRGVD